MIAPPITVLPAGVSFTISQTQNGARTISLNNNRVVRAAGTWRPAALKIGKPIPSKTPPLINPKTASVTGSANPPVMKLATVPITIPITPVKNT